MTTNKTIDISGQNFHLRITNSSLIGQGPYRNGFQSNGDAAYDTSLSFSGFGKMLGTINAVRMLNVPFNTYVECVYASPLSTQTTQNNMDFTCIYLFMGTWNAVLCDVHSQVASKYSRGQLQFIDEGPVVWLEAKDFSMDNVNEYWTILIHASNVNDRIQVSLNGTNAANSNHCYNTIINNEKVTRCMQGLKVQGDGGGYAMKSDESRMAV